VASGLNGGEDDDGEETPSSNTGIRVKMGQGIAGRVARDGKMIAIAQAHDDSRWSDGPQVDDKSGFQTHSMLCCPVKNSKGKVVAVIQFLNKQGGGTFDDNDIKLTELLCSHVGTS